MTPPLRPFTPESALLTLGNPSGLKIQLTQDGRLSAFRFGSLLLNGVIPGPVESAMTRLFLRDREHAHPPVALIGPPLHIQNGNVDPSIRFTQVDDRIAAWSVTLEGLEARIELQVHPEQPAWQWHVTLRNTGRAARTVDLLYGQDLGLANEGFVRMNEAYCSQYIDHRKVNDPEWGPVLLSRQNQAQDGNFPWMAQGCVEGATSWSTDGYQFFGRDHRITGKPAILESEGLPCTNLQYEFAYPALQSAPVRLEPGEESSVTFFAVFVEDHPDASSESDLTSIHHIIKDWPETVKLVDSDTIVPLVKTVFEEGWVHGDPLSEADWEALFPGAHHHEERNNEGQILSFFTDAGLHIVSRAKEINVERPHLHILRSGESLWLDDDILGTTVAMAGIFNAQVFLGNTNLARFMSVLRNPLGVMRSSGQRVFVQTEGDWRQLGVPSAFEMGLRHARWLYRIGKDTLEIVTTAEENRSEIRLEIRVTQGDAHAFLVTHLLLMGDNELTQPFGATFDAEGGRIESRPNPDSLLGQKWPDIRFTVAADPALIDALGGDELLFADRKSRGGPYGVLRTKAVTALTVTLKGENPNAEVLPTSPRSSMALPTLHHADPTAARISDLLPWFAHDAWIHFTTPHGLEQYGGAAWGTRDVCQGPVEWLLATRQYETVRRILLHVFEQQYETDGSWPQWFMFEPFRFIQSVHSHGDIVFWPLKALCDYLEASNDFAFLNMETPYTDPQTFTSAPRPASITDHVEKIINQYVARCLPGTALVNYGDGDWDDTLQPADPGLRSQMTSAWTVGLAYDALRRYQVVCERAGLSEISARLSELLKRIRENFNRLLIRDGVTAGFAILENGEFRPLLHPDDSDTGIRYRLLPMTRSVLAELFTPELARDHFEIIHRDLLCPDGVRLMSDPIPYQGGVERRFKRAESAANFGREVGLMYTHAHLRYAEALAMLGDGERLWHALLTVNPIEIQETVPNAEPRQANVYFTSSDGAFPDRYEAAKRFEELRTGTVAVKGGWRLYSSGPGLYLHKVITRLLGLRDSFGEMVIDPVLPRSLDGLTVKWEWDGKPLEVRYHVHDREFGPSRVTLNGHDLPIDHREGNPYRDGGLCLSQAAFDRHSLHDGNVLEIFM